MPDASASLANKVWREAARLSLGDGFGGVPKAWCNPGSGTPGVEMPEDPSDRGSEVRLFTGCSKYQNCNLIKGTDGCAPRWKALDALNECERALLKEANCYRVGADAEGWDVNALSARRAGGADNRWLANPLGARNPELGALANSRRLGGVSVKQRDLDPCPAGGCITPEMQRAQEWETKTLGQDAAVDFATSPACPYTNKFGDHELKVSHANPLRYLQCVIMGSECRELLRSLGVVVVAPIYRHLSSPSPNSSITHWYPFFTGLSAAQFPTIATDELVADDGRADGANLDARWALTGLARQLRLLYGAGVIADDPFATVLRSGWEGENGVVRVSDREATIHLLYWAIEKRLRVGPIDLNANIEWPFCTGDEDFFERLDQVEVLGYPPELEFDLKRRSGAGSARDWVRAASLEADLHWLGLLRIDGTPSERVQGALDELAEYLTRVQGAERREGDAYAFLRLSAPDLNRLRQTHRCPLRTLIAAIVLAIANRDIEFEADWRGPMRLSDPVPRAQIACVGTFDQSCRLDPQLHALVRRGWVRPVSWLFVPLSSAGHYAIPATKGRSATALILMMLENPDPTSGTVRSAEATANVQRALDEVLPLLHLVAWQEFGVLYEDQIERDVAVQQSRPVFHSIVHHLYTLHDRVTKQAANVRSGMIVDLAQSADRLAATITALAAMFALPAYEPSADRRTIAVGVDLLPVIKKAIRTYTLNWAQDRPVKFDLKAPKRLTRVSLYPLEEALTEDQARPQRAQIAFEFLLYELFLQRSFATESDFPVEIEVKRQTLNDRNVVMVAVRTPMTFKSEPEAWSYPLESISILPEGHGTRNCMGFAIVLGAVEAGFQNESGRGVMWMAFEERSSP